MKINRKKILDFMIKHHILLVVTIVPLSVIVFLVGLITYDQNSRFCYSCHIEKGPYVYFDRKRPVHKDVDLNSFNCIRCHKDKAVQVIYNRSLSKIKINAQLVGNLQAQPLINPKAVYTTEQCLNCHPDRLTVEEREPYLLQSDALKELGLRFDKRLHQRFELYQVEDQQLYEELMTRVTLTEDEKKELALLEKIRSGNCGQCHIQRQLVEGKKVVDKQVNYIARNPINCAGCHENTSSLNHPGQPLPTPTKEVCQKCHHGKIHGKFLIFKADCIDQKDTAHCVKCHPYFKPEMTIAEKKKIIVAEEIEEEVQY